MKSILIRSALRLAEKIRHAAANSRAATRFRALRAHIGEEMNDSRLGDLSEDRIGHAGRLYRLRRGGMRSREKSITEFLLQRAKNELLNSRIGNFGLFFLLTGVLFFILTLLIPTYSTSPQRTAALTLTLLSLPLLPSSKSLSHALKNSRIAGGILFDLCNLPTDTFGAHGKGKEHSLGILIVTAVSVAVGALISPLYWCVGALLCIAAILLFSFPETGLYLFALLFPLLPLLPSPTLIAAVFSLMLWLSYLFKAVCGRRELSPSLADFFALLFLLASLLGALIGFGDPLDGLAHTLLFSVYFPARGLLGEQQARRGMSYALSLGAFFCATIGILQYFFTDAAAQWLDAERFSDISMRVVSTFSNPNILSVYLLVCFPFALCHALDASLTRVRRCLFALTASSIALCILLTWTRGAWLGLLLQLTLILLFYSQKTLAAGLLLLPLLPCSLPYLPSNVLHRFTSIGTLAESSIRYRIYTWRGVNNLIAAHPWGIGIGEAAFCRLYPHYALPGIESVMHAHNIYLQIALECGVAGLFLFLLLIASVLLQATAVPLRQNAAPLALCGALVMGIFDHLWYFRPLAALFFMIVAMTGKEDLAQIA